MKYTLLILFFLIMSGIVIADNFEQTIFNVHSRGIQIAYPLNKYYELNSNISLNFDIMDSNFSKLPDANCTLFISDDKGNIENKYNLSYNSEFKTWNVYYVTNITGVHSYYLHCVSNSEAGYIVQNFDVTPTGMEKSQDTSALALIILIPFLISFIFISISWMLDSRKFWHLKLSLLVLAMIPAFWSYNYGVIIMDRFYDMPELSDTIVTHAFTYGIVFWAIILIVIFSVIKDLFDLFKMIKGKRVGNYDKE